MSQIQMLNGYFLVEKFDKAQKPGAGRFVTSMTSTNLGLIVKTSNSVSSFPKEGDKVYYGPKFELLVVEGKELLAMHADNFIAVLKDQHGA